MPNALLEAMASGVASIASRLPGVTDHVILDASSQLAFWANVDSILGTRGNVLVEAVNEADLAINRLEAQNQLPRPTRVTASHGRKGSDQLPVAPGFDYIRK